MNTSPCAELRDQLFDALDDLNRLARVQGGNGDLAKEIQVAEHRYKKAREDLAACEGSVKTGSEVRN